MENSNDVKSNILNKVNRKIKVRGLKISFFSIITCLLIVAILYILLFVKQTPISADSFKEVSITQKKEIINPISGQESLYNHLHFTVDHNIWYSVTESNAHFYAENNDDQNFATLYFYISESYMQKWKGQKQNQETLKILNQDVKKSDPENLQKFDQEQLQRLRQELVNEEQSSPWDILLVSPLCQSNRDHINEITKVYYLVYDYDKINQETFDTAKKDAILLWEK